MMRLFALDYTEQGGLRKEGRGREREREALASEWDAVIRQVREWLLQLSGAPTEVLFGAGHSKSHHGVTVGEIIRGRLRKAKT